MAAKKAEVEREQELSAEATLAAADAQSAERSEQELGHFWRGVLAAKKAEMGEEEQQVEPIAEAAEGAGGGEIGGPKDE